MTIALTPKYIGTQVSVLRQKSRLYVNNWHCCYASLYQWKQMSPTVHENETDDNSLRINSFYSNNLSQDTNSVNFVG